MRACVVRGARLRRGLGTRLWGLPGALPGAEGQQAQRPWGGRVDSRRVGCPSGGSRPVALRP
eukprot:1779707-Alexandrium_andersonii.AAC.1